MSPRLCGGHYRSLQGDISCRTRAGFSSRFLPSSAQKPLQPLKHLCTFLPVYLSKFQSCSSGLPAITGFTKVPRCRREGGGLRAGFSVWEPEDWVKFRGQTRRRARPPPDIHQQVPANLSADGIFAYLFSNDSTLFAADH